MAIAKTVFTSTTQAGNGTEVYAFLNANKSGYFDSVTQDESGNITCTVGGVACLKLGFDGSTKSVRITAANGTYSQNNWGVRKWEYAYVTSKGLWLYSNILIGYVSPNPISVFITKTNADDTAIVAIYDADSSSSEAFVTADVLNSGVAVRYIGNGIFASNSNAKAVYPSGVTTLTQIPLTAAGMSYAPYLYFTQFSQYPFTPSELTVGTTQYVYDGRIALRE